MPWTLTPANAVLAASAVAAAGLTALVMPRVGAEREYDAGGPPLSIAVVAPREPTPVAGPVMDVGEVIDGYEHRPYNPPPPLEPISFDWDDYEPLPMPEPRRWAHEPRWASEARVETTAAQPLPPRGDPGKFGFDEPMPDFAAARRERQARMDRIEADTAVRAQAPSGSELDPEAEFY